MSAWLLIPRYIAILAVCSRPDVEMPVRHLCYKITLRDLRTAESMPEVYPFC